MTLSTPTVSLIAAVAENGVIGKNNALPWHIPKDLKWFRDKTRHKPVIMGRKTFESVGHPLPERTNIVLTTQTDYRADGAIVHHSLSEAMVTALDAAKSNDKGEIFIIGGAGVYAEALEEEIVDKMYLTEVELSPDGDTYFPMWRRHEWTQIFEEHHEAQGDQPAFTFHILEKKESPEH